MSYPDTTTVAELKRWLTSLEESAKLNNHEFSDDTEIHIGTSYHGHSSISVLLPSCRHSFTFYDLERDEAFERAYNKLGELKKATDDATSQAYLDLYEDYDAFRRHELDAILGRKT